MHSCSWLKDTNQPQTCVHRVLLTGNRITVKNVVLTLCKMSYHVSYAVSCFTHNTYLDLCAISPYENRFNRDGVRAAGGCVTSLVPSASGGVQRGSGAREGRGRGEPPSYQLYWVPQHTISQSVSRLTPLCL